MKHMLRTFLGELTWQKLGQAKQEFKWRKIKDHAEPDLSDLIRKILPYERGFYVDVGANDGRSFSNTYVLEKSRNWTGILIEPILHKHFESKLYRSQKNNHFVYGACVALDYAEPTVAMYFSNLMTTSDLGYRKTWAESGVPFLRAGESVVPFWAPALTLASIFEKAEVQKIDFLSVDVEGAELSVLRGINFDQVQINSILIESSEDSEAVRYLTNLDFEYTFKLGNIHFFVKKCKSTHQ